MKRGPPANLSLVPRTRRTLSKPHLRMAPLPLPWRLVEPPETLHVVASMDELKIIAASQPKPTQWLKNMKQLLGLVDPPHGNFKRTVEGWMLLLEIKWIQKEGGTEFVPVVPLALDKFMRDVAANRSDMTFSEKNLRKLILGNYRSNGKKSNCLGKDKWGWVEPPADATKYLRDGALDAEQRAALERAIAAETAAVELASQKSDDLHAVTSAAAAAASAVALARETEQGVGAAAVRAPRSDGPRSALSLRREYFYLSMSMCMSMSIVHVHGPCRMSMTIYILYSHTSRVCHLHIRY
jgi:hypothetical protein